MSSKKKLLDQQLVSEFAEYRALKTKIEKWLKICSEQFVEQFKEGFTCPSNGPYLLELGGQNRKNIDWKDEFFLRLKADLEKAGTKAEESDVAAIAEMTRMETKAGTHRTDQVDVKVNPSYAGKVMRAMVKRLDSRTARGF